MRKRIAIIGFGEAGRAFAEPRTVVEFAAYDRIAGDPRMAEAAKASGITLARSAAEALAGAVGALSLVTADQALHAAHHYSGFLERGAFWLDMNSVAPDTKREAARAIAAAGGRYVDVAVMAPVRPARLSVPLLVSGPDADDAVALLHAIGFDHVRRIEGEVGAASAIKMIRSVIVKGVEALTAEALLAAEAAGVREELIASLNASEQRQSWAERGDYNLDRMLVHGTRRAAEMDEVVKTLDALGVGSVMSRATAARQRALGARGIATPPAGLDAKLAVLTAARQEEVA